MPTLEINLTIRKDGKPLQGFDPLFLRLNVDEFQSFGPTEEADDGDDTTFSDIPANQIASVQVMAFQAIDQALGLRAYAGSDANGAIRLDAGGLVLIVDATGITNTDLDVNNNSGSTAKTRGFVGGT